jgi:hypothetical protein
MGTAYEADLVIAAEVLAHVAAKQVASTARTQAPAFYVLCTQETVAAHIHTFEFTHSGRDSSLEVTDRPRKAVTLYTCPIWCRHAATL